MNNFTQTLFTSSKNSFNKFVAICSFLLVCNLSYGQAPFIQTGAADGLGQYGYLEKDATTFARLNSNTYGNIFLITGFITLVISLLRPRRLQN